MLLDTSGLLCFLSKNEPDHATAVQIMNDPSTLLLTHNYVLAELIALAIVRGFDHLMVTDYTLRLVDEVGVEVVWVDEVLHRAASDLILARPDKTYSLCDAVSFVLMRQRGVEAALTTDRHFEQEGFRRLLKA
ncbi:MAG: type II toxin-antitoxin system VapC family toxin [Spirulina sp. SIO3F2]|nr:type II toxin-antitoxin system VapC family toxin [Spirulina sp. SIO3F2]